MIALPGREGPGEDRAGGRSEAIHASDVEGFP